MSISFKKLHGSIEVKSLMKHCDKDERFINEHSNQDINKSMTEQNWQEGGNLTEAMKTYKDMIAYYDSTTNKNHRKDRVTAVSMEIPIPQEIGTAQNKEQVVRAIVEWLHDTYDADDYNKIIAIYYHIDEVHEYYDTINKCLATSKDHLHVLVPPIIEGQLNCKVFTSAGRMRKANQDLDKELIHEFGIHFLNGRRSQTHMKVETLKVLSDQNLTAEIYRQANELNERAVKIRDEIDKTVAQNRLQHDIYKKSLAFDVISQKYPEIVQNLSIEIDKAIQSDREARHAKHHHNNRDMEDEMILTRENLS